MSEAHTRLRLTRTAARRVAVRAQLLTAPRPTDLLGVINYLTLLQADQTAAVAPNAELVGWSRVGSVLGRRELDEAVTDGSLIELDGMLRPAEDIALFRAEMERCRGSGDLLEGQEAQRDWVEANDGCCSDILEKLADEGPLPSRVLPDTTVLPWQSSGWNNDRNVRMMLELMVQRGRLLRPVAMAGNGCGTWPSASIPTDRPRRSTRRSGSGPSGGCTRSVLPGHTRPRFPTNQTMSARSARQR